MKKYTITEKECAEMVEAMNTLTSENQKLRGFIDGMREQLIIGGVGSSMVKLFGNTTNKEYSGFTDQIIVVSKNGQTIVLEPEDLKKLEQAVGGKFRR